MSLKDLKEKLKRGPTDITGMDFGKTSVKIARLRKNGDAITLLGTALLPGFPSEAGSAAPVIPPALQARYVSIAISSGDATTKLLTFPGPVDTAFESNLAKNLGLSAETSDRMAYRIITEGVGRGESRVLAVSIPEPDVAPVMHLFSSGLPAPCSLELSSAAALTTFEAVPELHSAAAATGLLDFGTTSSTISIFYRKNLFFVRRFDFGVSKLLDRMTTTLNINLETAINILADNAFDISELIANIMGPFCSQLIVSRDFAERRENCSLKKLHVIGGIASAPSAIHEIERALNINVQIFDPFGAFSLQPPTPDALPAEGRWRFTAAIGAALGTLQEKP